ncbi:hypothetical protein [Fischerella thermalis]
MNLMLGAGTLIRSPKFGAIANAMISFLTAILIEVFCGQGFLH